MHRNSIEKDVILQENDLKKKEILCLNFYVL